MPQNRFQAALFAEEVLPMALNWPRMRIMQQPRIGPRSHTSSKRPSISMSAHLAASSERSACKPMSIHSFEELLSMASNWPAVALARCCFSALWHGLCLSVKAPRNKCRSQSTAVISFLLAFELTNPNVSQSPGRFSLHGTVCNIAAYLHCCLHLTLLQILNHPIHSLGEPFFIPINLGNKRTYLSTGNPAYLPAPDQRMGVGIALEQAYVSGYTSMQMAQQTDSFMGPGTCPLRSS